MSDCKITLETLADYSDGHLSDSDIMAVGSHLVAGCLRCAKSLTWLRPLVENLRGAGQILLPVHSLDRAQAHFSEQRRGVIEGTARALLVGRLMSDSRLFPSYGLRGSATNAYKLIYSTVAHDVDLWHEPQSNGCWYLIGRALPRDGSTPLRPGAAVLRTADQCGLVDLSLDGSEFHGSEISSGIYDLILNLPGAEILLPEIRIGE